MTKSWQSITEPTGIEAERNKYRTARTSQKVDVELNSQYVVVLAKVPAAAADDDFQSVKSAVLAINGVESVDAVADFATPETTVEGASFAVQVDTRLRVEGTDETEEV